jgi:hypothetical protein
MQTRICWLCLLFLTSGVQASAQQSSNLVGTWVGKVQGFGVEMQFTLRADGSAELEGAEGRWRVQANRLLLTQEGETVAYTFTLQGSRLTLSGGDLMAPMVLTRVAGATTALPDAAEANEPAAPPRHDSGAAVGHKQPSARPPASRRALSEAEVASLLEGGVAGPRIIELVEERGLAFAVTPAVLSRLKAKGATNALLGAIQQAADRAGPEAASAPARRDPLADAMAGGRSSSGGSRPAAARGPRFNYEKWGISFVMPSGWKAGEKQGLLLLGSDTEAGLIILRLARRTTLEQLIQDYGEGMQDEGFQLMPTVQAQSFPAGENRAAAGEMAGVAQDGARLRARTIAVASP